MLNKKEKFLDRIVKKDYNNELETILETKKFDENAKNLLLNILYKIEAAYKDYEKVKVKSKTKEEYIQNFIKTINENCDFIEICKINSNDKLKNKTFLVDKEQKKIICYPIERKLLYCISKISKNENIVKDKYQIINKTMSNLINVGNNIDTVEPLREFNGYSWTTIKNEIESISYNLIYQNLRILLGYEFLEKWIKNKEFIIDYMELLKSKLDERYGVRNEKDILKTIEVLSILLEIKYNPEEKENFRKEKENLSEELEKINDKEKFIEMITKEKKDLTDEIKLIDETINNKDLLQREYIKRNEKLPLKKKIFSARILYKLMIDEREEKIEKIESLNKLLNPKNFVEHKKKVEERYEYLKIADVEKTEEEIEKNLIKLQKIFIRCYKIRIKQVEEKTDITNLIYEFRYYNLLPFNYDINVNEVKQFKKEIEELKKMLIVKAGQLKVIITVSKDEEINNKILNKLFEIRAISLENIYLKISKEKESLQLSLFDDDSFEEKVEISNLKNISKKDVEIKFNKKYKVFE